MGDVITSADIANFLNKPLIGNEIQITKVSSLNNLKNYSLSFINKLCINENTDMNVLYLVPMDKEIDRKSKASYIKVKNPRLSFAKAVTEFFSKKFTEVIETSACIGTNVEIGKKVYIG